jgi:HPt (histidine-containing phosphotransfer) domain-containing protein
VIAMTASALAADRERALQSGMNAHIAKPLDVEQMFRMLAEWIVPRAAASPADPSAPASSELPPDLQALRTIDAADGLARCTGNELLYRRLLHGFMSAQSSFETDFAAARAAADWPRARHLAHDLKGLAGNLGAQTLHAAAARLQAASETRDVDATDAAMRELLPALNQALEEIAHLPHAPAGLWPVS